MRLESQIQKEIVDYLQSKGYFVWKNLTEGMRTSGRGRAKNPNAGMPDLCAVKNGITHYIEIKTQTGRLSENQLKWHSRAYTVGVIVHIFSSVTDCAVVF